MEADIVMSPSSTYSISTLEDREVGRSGSLRRRLDSDRIARLDRTITKHSGIHAAVGRVVVDRDPAESPVAEIAPLCRTWVRRRGDLHLQVGADPHSASDWHKRPLDAGGREVLACASGVDGMPFRL